MPEIKQIIPLIYFGVAIFIFEIMNWYGTKYVQQTWIEVSKYACLTLPLQFIAYVLLVMGLNLGYTEFKDIWQLVLLTTLITWTIKICTSFTFFQRIPTLGQVLALILVVLANLIQKVIH